MEYKRQLIENALLAMEPEKFQELCDAILQEEVFEYAHFVRTGSQIGKRKTRKGTPDTAFKLQNGRWFLVETTTKNREDSESAFMNKLTGDIQSCLDEFENEGIEKILLCTNAKISSSDSTSLSKIVEPKGAKLEIKGLDDWAGFLSGRYRHLAADFVGLAISSGQVISMNQFLHFYEKPGFQPGLRNEFFARGIELTELKALVLKKPLVFVTGKQGLGKSKLCVEAIRQLLAELPDWGCFCITKVAAISSIHNELQTLFNPNKNYIVLLDDANRQRSHLDEVIGFARQRNGGKIHIVATVRDYALNDLTEPFAESLPHVFTVQALNNDDLKLILESPDFNIKNNEYQQKILRLAQGNVRIAIMLARLAIKEQSLKSLDNVAQVYDLYFQRIQTDCSILKEPDALRVLGLLAFFFSIDMAQKEEYEKMLGIFELSDDTFREQVERLDELQFIEVSADKNLFRLSDQSLASYFFYRVFLRDGLLSFEHLLTQYFWTHKRKVKEAVISANNSFDGEAIAKQITPIVRSIWGQIDREDVALKFLDVFWFYLLDESLAFVLEKVESLPSIAHPVFETKEEKNNNLSVKDPYLLLLQKFLRHNFNYFRPAAKLGFAYVAKQPDLMPEWFKALSEEMPFSVEDRRVGFYRQIQLWECLEENWAAKKEEYLTVFPAFAAFYLRTSHSVHGSGVEKHSISFYKFQLPKNEPILELRKRVWGFIQSQFVVHPNLSFRAIRHFGDTEIRPSKELFESDLPYWLDIVNSCLNRDDFIHCYYVHKCIRRFGWQKIALPEAAQLKKNFTNQRLEYFNVLDRSRYRNLEDYEYEKLPYEEYERLKDAEIADYFQFENIAACKDFFEEYKYLVTNDFAQPREANRSLDHILVSHFSKDPDLALEFVEYIFKTGNEVGQHAGWFTSNVASQDKKRGEELFQLIYRYDFSSKGHWLFLFLEKVPEEWVSKSHYETLIIFLQNNINPLYLSDLSFLSKFKKYNLRVFREVLNIIIEKYEKESVSFKLWPRFFETQLHHFQDEDLPLIKKAYFICEIKDRHFDFNSRSWLEIVKRDAGFVMEYYQQKFSINALRSSNDHNKFGLIWELENAAETVEDAMVKIANKEKPLIRPFLSNASELFIGFPEEKRQEIETFLLAIIEKHHQHVALMQMVFTIVRSGFPDLYEPAFLKLLTLNTDLEFFKEIHWGDSMSRTGAYWGKKIHGSEEADRWRTVLEFLGKVSQQLSVLKHKAYVNEQIAHAEEWAERERRRYFGDDF